MDRKFVASTLVSLALLFHDMRQGDEQSQAAKLSYAAATEANKLSEQSLRETREAKLQAQKPWLTVDRPCNPVPVRMFSGTNRVELRCIDKPAGEVTNWNDELQLRTELAYVCRVRNIGDGLARSIKVRWEIEEVVGRDGQVLPWFELEPDKQTTTYLTPNALRSGEVGINFSLPYLSSYDKKLYIKKLSGTLVMTCYDSLRNLHEFRQQFTMHTVWEPSVVDLIGKRLHFHFEDTEHLEPIDVSDIYQP